MKISFSRLFQSLCLMLGFSIGLPAVASAGDVCFKQFRGKGNCPPAHNGCNCQSCPSDAASETGSPTPSDALNQPSSAEPMPSESFNLGEAGPAQGGDFLAITDPGYIDSAIIRTRFRLRYDRTTGGDSDRAGFLYGPYANPGFNYPVPPNNVVNGPTDFVIRTIDYHEVTGFVEYKLRDRLSVFGELPIRFTDVGGAELSSVGTPINRHDGGLGDINVGFRAALQDQPDKHLTFQLKVFAPTGDANNALGTGHTSIQPGLLYQRDFDRVTLFSEIHDWIGISDRNAITTDGNPPGSGPLTGQNFTGNVLRVGAGGAYHLMDCEHRRLSAVAEFVGWTVLDGLKSVPTFDAGGGLTGINLANATGDTIVNGKFGFRYVVNQRHSFYVGYGVPFTGDQLYKSILRAEYTVNQW